MNWRLGVAGSPIAHSLSPQLHAEGLRQAGLVGTSERLEVTAVEAGRLGELLGSSFDALSVTMPLKSVAANYCDELDEVATRTGSVNSMLATNGRVRGASTDGQGFLDALAGELDVGVAQAHVVVLGTGGAARAIVDALVAAGVADVAVDGRTESNVTAITSRYDNVHPFAQGHRRIELVVNTVPTGGRVATAALLDGVGPETVAVDIAYEPTTTPWRALYQSAGCRTQNGLAMLAHQAALQMRWWWQIEIDASMLLRVIS